MEMAQLADMFSKFWPYLSIPLIFLAIVAWTFRPAATGRYRADGKIPFEDEERHDSAR
jgi:cbb3-type cytochrome oxidase subunit 3